MFKACYCPAGGHVLVLIVREDRGDRRAFMCSNLLATAWAILDSVADQFAVGQNFHDLKQIEGTGQQQVRSFWANVGEFHLNMWVHTMIEMRARNKSARAICDRSDSPWGAIDRRPSQSDR